jgi:hypothetical protein
MSTQYEGVSHVVHISTDIKKSCEHCKESIGHQRFAESINHYITHGYKLLHVGSETSYDEDSKPWHSTIAVMGK